MTLGTLDLREFEVMPKRNRKKRKKRDKNVEKGEGKNWQGQCRNAMAGMQADSDHLPHLLPVQGLVLKRLDTSVGSLAWSQ